MKTGERFGRWTVVSPEITDKKILCKCDCGTERYVLERSLIYGGSKSCGCSKSLNREIKDLTGQKFGELTVISRIEEKRKGGVWWLCKCDCGEDYEVQGTLLVGGRKTDCGGAKHTKNYVYSDISGQKFGRLTALNATEKRDNKGYIIWNCLCDCGNEVEISYNNLLYTKQNSCGCQRKENNQKLATYLTHVAGTSVDSLKSKKVPTDNTTGYKGVYFIRGKYVAKIVFQKKAYYLGAFESINDAAEARKEAEEVLFDGMAKHYEMWKEKADVDPEWAKDNPVEVIVNQRKDKKLSVTFLPDMSAIHTNEHTYHSRSKRTSSETLNTEYLRTNIR